MFNDLKDVKEYCAENGIKIADFMMTDLNGRWRHLSMPIDRLTESTMQYGVGFDGSNYGFAPVEKSDMVFVPDLQTGYEDAFAEVPTITFICDVFVIDVPDNYRFGQYPRNVAVHAEEFMRSSGIADEMILGPEFEFHVFDHISYVVKPHGSMFHIDAEQAEWNTGAEPNNLGYKTPHKGGYHTAPPMDRLAGFRSRVSLLMEARGIGVKYHHHEVGGPGQIEIEVEPGGLLDMADKTMMTKYIVKNAAVSEGKTATFMPKPVYDEAGNGLHMHMQLFKGGKPLFYDPNGYSQLSETALFFIGGLLRHARALCAFTNPSTNSYKRLVPGYEAPVTIGFATANRSAVIRVPAYAKAPEHKRFELRSPDATSNPYYAFSAVLMAGIDGVLNKIDPIKEGYGPFDYNLYTLSEEEKSKFKYLPYSLGEALDALESDYAFLTRENVFPMELINIWLKNKRAEVAQFNKLPHPAEFGMYFDL
ncbi:MAG: type I glutamate--ammonia ligase [Oscillospiraceae bacterium]|nr:type I glutamate--ammonia ligase [Oscillospiraceae bacterium]